MSELTHPGSESRARSKFYLTTPIYYVNARPHIGHAYTTIVADVLARRHRLLGDDTFFLTGTDEHGQKIERSAAAAGIAPQEFTDQVSATFREPWLRMGLTYDDFIRTTEPRHQRGVQKLFKVLEENGFIYLDTYTGQYCITDEAYVDGPPGVVCPDCGNVTETISESNYYFRLSAFEQKILELIETNAMVIEPATLRNEVLSFVRSGL
jgi:methionyl-tRNA synthetase